MKQKKVLVFLMLICTCFIFLFSGCTTTTGLKQSFEVELSATDMVDVRINVLLEKEFVRDMSSFSAIGIFIGPFSDSIVNIYGSIQESGEKQRTIGSFTKQLHWGENSFNIEAPQNAEIQFKLHVDGTRAGLTDIGFTKIGTEPKQTIIIELVEFGATIK